MKITLKAIAIVILSMVFTSCGSSHSKITSRTEKNHIEPVDKKVQNIISHAKKFEGTRYKFGGTTKRGMDCSGLIYTSFLEEDISLPRISRDMALKGKRLHLKEVSKGDLLFFETNKNRKVINHVGLVVDVQQDDIFFIHSSTSRGVIISSLSENYWKSNFVMARRIL